ncbi:hypothetical protein BKD30_12340 [Tersicoccus phoenicis]|uniref:DUF4352 domain-containing protein n=1 Tax=Tersicoccus phoenicis TaxID=554083 RepID=A0A1R1L7A4_9MICC|nr:DUF4352 domain-containing protein [Tersicoccus phoenicis]OMH23418.1 hypothetical protein BKD30_12340 [Tersicoccus phoenicis]
MNATITTSHSASHTISQEITMFRTTLSRSSLRRIGTVTTGLALAGSLAACGSSTTAADSDSTAAASSAVSSAAPSSAAAADATPAGPVVGKPFTADMGKGNVARITIVSAKYSTGSVGQFAPAPTKGGYLVLDVLWETEKGTTTSNPLYFAAKDAQGRKSDTILGADGQLGSGEVPAGDKTRGVVAFDIAKGPTTVIVTDQLLQEAARVPVKV